jgi:hypothetical protein
VITQTQGHEEIFLKVTKLQGRETGIFNTGLHGSKACVPYAVSYFANSLVGPCTITVFIIQMQENVSILI